MKLEKFKEQNNKRIGIIVFTITCILLVSGVILYRTFAIFEVKTHQNIINGTVEDPGNIYFAFYVDNNIQKEMPQKNEGYIFDEESSYCGVTGENDNNITLEFDQERWGITVLGIKTSRTKCNLYFVKGAYILEKPIKAVTNGDGLYEVTHGDEVSGTLNDDGFKQTEWRYAGQNPNNYIKFNNETWRIIGLVNVMTEENKVEQRIKIIRDENIGKYAWDSNKSNDWTKSTLMTHLNDTYYTTFNENAKNMVDQKITWNIGGWDTSDMTANEIYSYERSKNTYNSQPYVWKKDNETIFQSIGLTYPSDYGYAVGGDAHEICLSTSLLIYDIKKCYKGNWLYTGEWTWLLTPNSTFDSYSLRAFVLYDGGSIYYNGTAFEAFIIFPTLYLKPEVYITSGTGEPTSAFELSME